MLFLFSVLVFDLSGEDYHEHPISYWPPYWLKFGSASAWENTTQFSKMSQNGPCFCFLTHRYLQPFNSTLTLNPDVNPGFPVFFYLFVILDWHWKLGSYRAEGNEMVRWQILAISRCHCGIGMVGCHWAYETYQQVWASFCCCANRHCDVLH